MAITIVPFEAQHVEAARRFNQRLIAGKAATPFLMDETAPGAGSEKEQTRQMVALEGDEIRGSYLEVRYPSTVAGVETEVLNCQSPISEGLVNEAYIMLPSQMFKVMQRTNPYVFVVGMGSLRNPLPRFLAAAGWGVEEVPFFYHVLRASRFLKEMPMLQRPAWKRAAAHIAAATGTGSLAFRWLHRGSKTEALHNWSLAEGEWDAWATDLWHRLRPEIRFAVTRDEVSLPRLFPGGREIGPLVVKHQGAVCGWAEALLTSMQNSSHFGNLRVATILDCVADKGSEVPAIVRTVEYLRSKGADIVVTNQAFGPSKQAFSAAGFRQGASNYVLAASPKLTKAIGGKPVESGLVYVTRTDGDGRINL